MFAHVGESISDLHIISRDVKGKESVAIQRGVVAGWGEAHTESVCVYNNLRLFTFREAVLSWNGTRATYCLPRLFHLLLLGETELDFLKALKSDSKRGNSHTYKISV